MMLWIWLGAIVVFGAVEAATAGLVSIWFVAGAVAALIATLLGASELAQVAVFLIVSALMLAVTRPAIRRLTHKKAEATNLDRVIGLTGKVTEAIDNENSTGAVYVDGKTWTARSADGTVFPVNELVHISKMEGVKLLVEKAAVSREAR